MSNFTEKPNGCDEDHWEECEEKGYLKNGVFCLHPKDAYDPRTNAFICPYKKNAVDKIKEVKKYK